MNYLFEEAPVHIEVTGYCHVNEHLPDIVYLAAHYASNMICTSQSELDVAREGERVASVAANRW
jgi:hypothetical protein